MTASSLDWVLQGLRPVCYWVHCSHRLSIHLHRRNSASRNYHLTVGTQPFQAHFSIPFQKPHTQLYLAKMCNFIDVVPNVFNLKVKVHFYFLGIIVIHKSRHCSHYKFDKCARFGCFELLLFHFCFDPCILLNIVKGLPLFIMQYMGLIKILKWFKLFRAEDEHADSGLTAL